jgi:hypothetical protein
MSLVTLSPYLSYDPAPAAYPIALDWLVPRLGGDKATTTTSLLARGLGPDNPLAHELWSELDGTSTLSPHALLTLVLTNPNRDLQSLMVPSAYSYAIKSARRDLEGLRPGLEEFVRRAALNDDYGAVHNQDTRYARFMTAALALQQPFLSDPATYDLHCALESLRAAGVWPSSNKTSGFAPSQLRLRYIRPFLPNAWWS